MTREELKKIEILPPDSETFQAAKRNWDKIAKPLDSLGEFETLVCRLAAMTGRLNYSAPKKAIIVACGDNGIVEEGVTQCGQEVTSAVAKNLGLGLSSLCILAKRTGAKIIPVDVGINSDEKYEGVIDRKIAKGSRNFLKEPALTEAEALLAIEYGIDLVDSLKSEGFDLLATGEMGIGNTTTSTAIQCSIFEFDPETLTGRGAGLSDEGLARKLEVVKKGIEKYGDSKDPLHILHCLGGYDLAFLTGVYIGGAIYRLPVIIDGFISVTAAVLAEALLPGTKEYMVPSHKGRSEGIEFALKSLGLKPYINGEMALGEGTGGAMLLPIIDMVLDYYNNGSSFEAEEIESYTRF